MYKAMHKGEVKDCTRAERRHAKRRFARKQRRLAKMCGQPRWWTM